uniref:Lipoprotein n=1 Tax=Streptomyces lavendulae subsp. lavendulae TaxID=58340 RepID=D2Z038_STRLA|nr:lipoprotein [Streptomyces lavendulae subsp. lavendulae]
MTIPSVPAASGSDGSGVRADPLPTGDSGIAAAYEVTNGGTQALAYTILFDFTTDAGEVMANSTATVRAVGPGATVRGTVRLGAPGPGSSRVTRVKVSRVTKVPAAEAPPAADVCPPSGIRVTADDGDAAMGLRVVGLQLENCGKRDYSLDGYPLLELLDKNLSPVQGVRIVQGSGGITTGTGFDEPAHPLVLKPGESALSGLMWRNTTESGDPVNVPHVRVRAKADAEPVTVTPHLDLGTTGLLAVRAWTRPSPEELRPR